MIEFKPGDPWHAAGVATIDGISDFTGYTANASIAQRMPNGSVGVLLATVNDMPMSALGGFLMEVPGGETADWPVGVVLMIDVVIHAPSGLVATTETGEFRTVARITAPE